MENIINAAQIENELVVNVIVVTDINFLPDLVEIPNNLDVGIGWGYVNGAFVAPAIPEPTAEENKATAVTLLEATDWTQIPSVSDPSLSNPYLSNKLAFDQYRDAVRQYAVYPVAGNITWPTEPDENWVKV
jgi:hypothetical protein